MLREVPAVADPQTYRSVVLEPLHQMGLRWVEEIGVNEVFDGHFVTNNWVIQKAENDPSWADGSLLSMMPYKNRQEMMTFCQTPLAEHALIYTAHELWDAPRQTREIERTGKVTAQILKPAGMIALGVGWEVTKIIFASFAETMAVLDPAVFAVFPFKDSTLGYWVCLTRWNLEMVRK